MANRNSENAWSLAIQVSLLFGAWEIRLVANRLFQYRQPEIEGFEEF